MAHAQEKIRQARIYSSPFIFFYVTKIFPDDYYCELLSNWPIGELFTDIADAGRIGRGGYTPNSRLIIEKRQLASLDDTRPGVSAFWRSFSEYFYGREFNRFLFEWLKKYIRSQRADLPSSFALGVDGQLVQDTTNYSIGPHTDSPRRLVSTLLYCPKDHSRRHLGTSVYVPISDSIPLEVSPRHYSFAQFKKVATAAYSPNSMFGFVVSPTSFHGVEPIADHNPMRRSILHYLQAIPLKPAIS